VKIFWKRH